MNTHTIALLAFVIAAFAGALALVCWYMIRTLMLAICGEPGDEHPTDFGGG